jgi:predicted O-methyltransferase YrrM
VTSYEHCRSWYDTVSRMLTERGVTNSDYRYLSGASYAEAVLALPDASVDVLVIDGRQRVRTLANGLPKLRRGGLLVFDNINVYVPMNSQSPGSKLEWTLDDPADSTLREIWDQISRWRRFYSSNRVVDTAIFFRPFFERNREECDVALV